MAESQLHIFVNGKKKTSADGVSNPMAIEAIAALVDIPAAQAVVRQEQGESGKASDPLTGTIPINNGEHFLVTRNAVQGGVNDD